MNSKIKFFITDVFGEKKYSGNQLATFLDCASLSSREMQQIAREINFSETTFITSDSTKNNGYNVRIFTPLKEINFAGHPTLGTAFIIQKYLIKKLVKDVVLNLKVGSITVSFSPENNANSILWMNQIEPIFGKNLDASHMAQVLGFNRDDIDTRWPIEQVSTGLPHIIVPLRTLNALKRARIVKEQYQKLTKESWAKAILIFCPEVYTKQHDLSVRVFVDYYGIPEDPATGSGNGCLAGYLLKNNYFQSKTIDIQTGQGYEIGRPSILFLRATEENKRIKITVGGQVIQIAEGWWT